MKLLNALKIFKKKDGVYNNPQLKHYNKLVKSNKFCNGEGDY